MYVGMSDRQPSQRYAMSQETVEKWMAACPSAEQLAFTCNLLRSNLGRPPGHELTSWSASSAAASRPCARWSTGA
jgi:hypothetical protein